MDIEVNYKNKRRYKTAKYSLHQSKFWTWLIWLLSKIAPLGKDYRMVISTENDSFYCCLSKPNRITKLAFATVVIYGNSSKQLKQK